MLKLFGLGSRGVREAQAFWPGVTRGHVGYVALRGVTWGHVGLGTVGDD